MINDLGKKEAGGEKEKQLYFIQKKTAIRKGGHKKVSTALRWIKRTKPTEDNGGISV